MKIIAAVLLFIVSVGVVAGQQTTTAPQAGLPAAVTDTSNLPSEQIGADDLIGITVYDAPELSRTVRVDQDGTIRLPMLQKHIVAAGVYPENLERAIRAGLMDEQVLTDPVVSVSVIEYRSRPISIVGAVKTSITIQDTGTVTLLDALSRAGGLAENAGAEILVSRPQPGPDGKLTPSVQKIPVRALYDAVDPTLNIVLRGGDLVRVPEAGRVYVVGDVKRPGMFALTDGYQSSVLKALALSEGLDRYPQKLAYVYRAEPGKPEKTEIPIELKKIMHRQSPDVPLMANDILYVPEASTRKATMTALDRSLMVGIALSGTLLYLTQ
jgi:polysaccharide export outer membrane protein